MKNYKNLLFVCVMLMAQPLWAAAGTDVGVYFGIKNATMKTDAAAAPDYKSQTGLMGGVIAIGEMGGFLFRTGGYYAERKAEISSSNLSADLSVATIDVPVTMLFKFNDMLGVYAGAVLALKVADDCSGDSSICNSDTMKDIKSFYSAATVGLHAKFHPNWSGELSYEFGLSDVAKDTSVSALSVGVAFIY